MIRMHCLRRAASPAATGIDPLDSFLGSGPMHAGTHRDRIDTFGKLSPGTAVLLHVLLFYP